MTNKKSNGQNKRGKLTSPPIAIISEHPTDDAASYAMPFPKPPKPFPNFVGMYFIVLKNDQFRTGQIIAQIGEGYFLIQYDNVHEPALPLTVKSAADFTKRSNGCFLDWQFFADVESREKWMASVRNWASFAVSCKRVAAYEGTRD